MAGSIDNQNNDVEVNVHQMDVKNHYDSVVIDALRESFDAEILNTLLESYLKNSLVTIEEIKSSYSENNIEALGDLAHKLKGSSGNLGAAMLFDRARLLEAAAKNKVEPSDIALALKNLLEEYQFIRENLKNRLIPQG